MRTSCRARPPCGYAAQSPAGDRVAMGEPSPLALSAGQLRSCNGPKIGAEKLRRQNVAFIWPMSGGCSDWKTGVHVMRTRTRGGKQNAQAAVRQKNDRLTNSHGTQMGPTMMLSPAG